MFFVIVCSFFLSLSSCFRQTRNYINFNFFFFFSSIYLFIFSFFFLNDIGLTFCWSYFFLDHVSSCFILLTFFLLPFCLLLGFQYNDILYVVFFWFLSFFIFLTFTTSHLFLFYFFFELVTLCMFFILIGWGYEERRILAGYYFFYFTFIGSLIFLFGLLKLYSLTGTAFFSLLLSFSFSFYDQCFFWWFFFFAFAIKIPMYPFHIWLPEAHVEAPTAGSIFLAAVLLKLGFYGFYRFLLPCFFMASQYYLFLLYVLCFLGIAHSMLVALRQLDAKRIIAYASIAHMNFGLLGLFSGTYHGLLGSLFLMIGHGLISSGLFFSIGVLYNRYNTRLLFYYGGLSYTMPLFTFYFFFFILANISFPLTIGFPAEFFVFLSILTKSKIVFILIIPFLVLNLINSLLLYVRICHGVLKRSFISFYFDLTWVELFFNFLLFFFILFFGIYPNYFLDFVSGELMFYMSYLHLNAK